MDVNNVGGIAKTTYDNAKQILFDARHFVALPIVLKNEAKESDGMCYAGTPITGSFAARTTPFTKAAEVAAVAGVFSVQITTAFAADEKLTIGGVEYTCKAAENVAAKQFVGASAAEQATSLAKMVVLAEYNVTASTDKLLFTQKVAGFGEAPTATESATTGVLGAVTRVTAYAFGSCNAVGVLLHDVTLGASGDKNAVLLVHGFVNEGRLSNAVKAMLTPAVKAALKNITFIS